jgi:signal peptide peptidase SppA
MTTMKPETPNLPAALIEAVYFKHWFITQSAHSAIRSRVESAMAREIDWLGMKFEQPGMTIEDGIAIVPIKGTMGRGFTGFGKVDLIFGDAVDVEMVASEIREADNNPKVEAILLDIDSPGGMVNGTPELGNVIAGLSTPVYAFTAGMMCSAAYWAGCAASHGGVYATESADIGSIGVYQMHMDWSGFLESMGVKAELFKSAEYKAMGHPYIALTEKQKEMMQAEVLQLSQGFYDWVNQNRSGRVNPEAMQGQTVMGYDALGYNLIDGVVSGKDEMLSLIREAIG